MQRLLQAANKVVDQVGTINGDLFARNTHLQPLLAAVSLQEGA